VFVFGLRVRLIEVTFVKENRSYFYISELNLSHKSKWCFACVAFCERLGRSRRWPTHSSLRKPLYFYSALRTPWVLSS